MSLLVGRSRWAQQVRAAIARAALTDLTVLIHGPTGTGKELIARLMHQHSWRRQGPFVVVDCPAITPTLLATQLFGHVRGAFSGAERDAAGFFRTANGGDIFFDEIAELACELQAHLLRAIEQRVVTPLGSFHEVPVDVRVIAATSRDLERETAARRFRSDLYYRLKVLELRTIPLCQRPEDVEPLCCYFLDQLARARSLPPKRLSAAAVRLLESFHWPGNVRQLRNLLERAYTFCDAEELPQQAISELLDTEESCGTTGPGQTLAASGSPGNELRPPLGPWQGPFHGDVCEHLAGCQPPTAANGCTQTGSSETQWPTWAQVERQLIEATLRRTGYNQAAAAKALGIDRRLLARRIHRYGIVLPQGDFRLRAA